MTVPPNPTRTSSATFLLTRMSAAGRLEPLVVKIPKAAVLSARACALSADIPFCPYGREAQFGLSLAVYGEL